MQLLVFQTTNPRRAYWTEYIHHRQLILLSELSLQSSKAIILRPLLHILIRASVHRSTHQHSASIQKSPSQHAAFLQSAASVDVEMTHTDVDVGLQSKFDLFYNLAQRLLSYPERSVAVTSHNRNKLQFITLLTAIMLCFTHRKQQK